MCGVAYNLNCYLDDYLNTRRSYYEYGNQRILTDHYSAHPAQFLLLGYTIFHILKHDSYKRGNRAIWLAVAIIGMEFIGPIIYFVFGKEEE